MSNIKTYLHNFFEKNKHLWILSYFIIYLLWFGYVETAVTSHFHVIHTHLDDYIPFCEFFVVPYFLWFGYVAWGFICFGLHSKQDFFRMCAFLFTGMTIFLIISTVYPNGHYLRPCVFERDNIFTRLCAFLYSTDTATNLFPSIHVYNSIGVHLAVVKSEKFGKNRLVKTLSFLLMFSIVLSTMFIKQHSTFDVLTALLLCAIMYRIVYLKNESTVFKHHGKTARHVHKRLPQS